MSSCDASEAGVRAGDGLVSVSYTVVGATTTMGTGATTTPTTLAGAKPAGAVVAEPTFTG